MDQPLGMAVGNALEVARGDRDAARARARRRSPSCAWRSARKMLVLGERARDEDEARALLAEAIADGRALEHVPASGSRRRAATRASPTTRRCCRARRAYARGRAPRRRATSPASTPRAWAARRCCSGAGRATTDDAIDPGAGLVLRGAASATASTPGDLLCTLYAADEALLDAGEERFRRRCASAPSRSQPPPLFHEL